MDGRRARTVLGVGTDAGPTEIRRAFRARALVTHPDHGGDRYEFAELVEALAAIGTPVVEPEATTPLRTKPFVANRPRFDAYDSSRRPAPRRSFADVLQAAAARLA